MQKASIPHLAPIDGLRAVAVLSVMLYHLNGALLPGGFLGVDIFFVISGFVVSGALPPSGITGIRQLLGLFYARRATRILPALYVCLLVSSLLSMLFIPYSWLSAINERTGLAAVLGYSNFVLAHAEGNYFAPRAEYNMFTHTWSLGVEEQFYALFPWLFLPWLTGRRALSAGLFAAALVLSVALAYHAAGTDRIAGFYLIFSRFWELALGVLAFQLSSRPGFIATGRPAAFASLACAAVLAYAFATTAADRTPYPASLLPCGATALLLALVRAGTESRVLRSGLTSRPVVYIGRISYSLYLWHWPVYVLFRWTVGLESPVAAVIATLIAFGAASASYRYVETPPRRALAGGRIAPRAALAAAAILVAAFYPLQKSVWPLRSTISLSTVVRHKRDWYPDTDVKTTSPSGCKVRAVQAKGLDISALAFQRSACPAPSPPPPALFILGDSHASAYADLLADYVLNSGAQGMLYAKGGCAMLGQKPGDEHACAAFIDTAIADLERRVKRGDVVFLPGLRIPRIVGQHIRFGEQHARDVMFGDAEIQWHARNRAATVPVLARLVSEGASVVLEAPKPEFGAPTFRCADWFNRMNPICAEGSTIKRALIEQLRAPVMDEFRAVTDAVPGVRVWDPLPVLCPGDVCSAYAGERPLYFDADHLSGYANRLLAPDLLEFSVGRVAREKARGFAPGTPLGP